MSELQVKIIEILDITLDQEGELSSWEGSAIINGRLTIGYFPCKESSIDWSPLLLEAQ